MRCKGMVREGSCGNLTLARLGVTLGMLSLPRVRDSTAVLAMVYVSFVKT